MTNEIPPITESRGAYWDQPPRERILVDDHHAIISDSDWDALHHYDISIPTGTYTGKIWGRSLPDGRRFVCWYGEIVGDQINIESRLVL